MIHRDGRVLVTDFGLVRRDGAAETPATPAPAGELRADLTQFGTIVGTPGYMPPEQFAGRTTDARSGQFSFCVSLWEMLLGQRPFVGASALEIEEAVLRGAVSQPPRSDVPTWLREHILRGFACEPSERWRTMDELLAALARDPTPRRRAIVAGGVATAVALSVGGWTAMANARERDARLAECERSGREIEADWNEATAAAIEQAFLATGRPQAASIWAHARQWMDDHARAWTALRTRTCTEARVDATRDEASFVSIADCLDERRAGFAGVLDVWAERDHSKLLLAASAAAALPPISLCADEAHLARLARPPTSLRPQIKGVQLQVERIKSMRQAGAYEAALASSQALLPEAEALGWAPLLALVRLEIGFDQAELGQYTDSRASVEQSFLDAASGGDELGMLNAATKLSHTVGNLLGQFEQGHYWGRVALAVLTHLGMEGTTAEASLHNSVGSIHFKQGAQAPALELYRRALAIYESALGPRAPAVATSLNNIASALRSAGEYGESLDPYTRALELREAVYGPDHPSVAYPLHGLGQSYKALGEYARARALLERAVSLREHGVEPAKLAGSRFGLAEVLWATDERPRARALAEAARDGFREAGAGSEKDLARVETWLREHPP